MLRNKVYDIKTVINPKCIALGHIDPKVIAMRLFCVM